jgi:hypothetical protein
VPYTNAMLSSATLIWHEAALASVLLWVLNVGPAALPQTVCAAAAGTKIAASVGSKISTSPPL